MTASIRSITPPRETLEFDHDRLTALCVAHGRGAEAEIARILGLIESGLQTATERFAADDLVALREEADRLVRCGRRIGLRNLVTAGVAVCDRLDAGDPAGLAACVGRLDRLAEPGRAPGWQIKAGDAG